MIETTLLTYLLNKTSAGTDVYSERPVTIPSEYVLIEKTGSTRDNMITTSTIAIQSISDSLQGGSMLQALTLNEEVKEAILGGDNSYGIVDMDEIIKVELNSDYNFTDPSTSEYRYQAVFAITHY